MNLLTLNKDLLEHLQVSFEDALYSLRYINDSKNQPHLEDHDFLSLNEKLKLIESQIKLHFKNGEGLEKKSDSEFEYSNNPQQSIHIQEAQLKIFTTILKSLLNSKENYPIRSK